MTRIQSFHQRMSLAAAQTLRQSPEYILSGLVSAAENCCALLSQLPPHEQAEARQTVLATVMPIIDPLLDNGKDAERRSVAVVSAHLAESLGPRGSLVEVTPAGRYGNDAVFERRTRGPRQHPQRFVLEAKTAKFPNGCRTLTMAIRIGAFDRIHERVRMRGRRAWLSGRDLMQKERSATNMIAFSLRAPALSSDPLITWLVDPDRIARTVRAKAVARAMELRADLRRGKKKGTDMLQVTPREVFAAGAEVIQVEERALAAAIASGHIRFCHEFVDQAIAHATPSVCKSIKRLVASQ